LKKAGIGVDLVAYPGARSQSEQRIADQTRRRFICLREKADSIRDNGAKGFRLKAGLRTDSQKA
jgi:hypothetical protein